MGHRYPPAPPKSRAIAALTLAWRPLSTDARRYATGAKVPAGLGPELLGFGAAHGAGQHLRLTGAGDAGRDDHGARHDPATRGTLEVERVGAAVGVLRARLEDRREKTALAQVGGSSSRHHQSSTSPTNPGGYCVGRRTLGPPVTSGADPFGRLNGVQRLRHEPAATISECSQRAGSEGTTDTPRVAIDQRSKRHLVVDLAPTASQHDSNPCQRPLRLRIALNVLAAGLLAPLLKQRPRGIQAGPSYSKQLGIS